MSEYDPAFSGGAEGAGAHDLDEVRGAFARASRPYLSSSLPWLGWAVLLPAAALATPTALADGGPPRVLLLWCVAILVGGLIEGAILLRARARLGATPLGSWAMTAQGNLSIVAAALSIALVASDRAEMLPALWLLLTGHSLFVLGGLALPAMRFSGVVYQLGGIAALVPGIPALTVFAVATALGNLSIALGVARRRGAAGAR